MRRMLQKCSGGRGDAGVAGGEGCVKSVTKNGCGTVGDAQEGSALGRKEPLVHVAEVVVGVCVSYVDVDIADMRRMLQK